MFLYCGNNPVIRYDDGGTSWKTFVSTAIHAGNTAAITVGIDTAAIGGFCLNMTPDKKVYTTLRSIVGSNTADTMFFMIRFSL